MKRRLFNLLTAMSLVLCAASVGMWIRTFFVTDDWAVSRWSQESMVIQDLKVAWGGEFANASYKQMAPKQAIVLKHQAAPRIAWEHQTFPPAKQGLWSWLWWDHYIDQQTAFITECWRIQVRPWLPAVISMILPAVWVRGFVRRRRQGRQGQCAVCGYDLRATPERCPECGTAVRGQRSELSAVGGTIRS